MLLNLQSQFKRKTAKWLLQMRTAVLLLQSKLALIAFLLLELFSLLCCLLVRYFVFVTVANI
jgi:hypothetical protein